jgi:hypothetical protein
MKSTYTDDGGRPGYTALKKPFRVIWIGASNGVYHTAEIKAHTPRAAALHLLQSLAIVRDEQQITLDSNRSGLALYSVLVPNRKTGWWKYKGSVVAIPFRRRT